MLPCPTYFGTIQICVIFGKQQHFPLLLSLHRHTIWKYLFLVHVLFKDILHPLYSAIYLLTFGHPHLNVKITLQNIFYKPYYPHFRITSQYKADNLSQENLFTFSNPFSTKSCLFLSSFTSSSISNATSSGF